MERKEMTGEELKSHQRDLGNQPPAPAKPKQIDMFVAPEPVKEVEQTEQYDYDPKN